LRTHEEFENGECHVLRGRERPEAGSGQDLDGTVAGEKIRSFREPNRVRHAVNGLET
jgi:hypothetical protein